MSVNLRRFVNMNISRTRRNATNPIRDTVALYGATDETTAERKADWTSSFSKLPDLIFTSGALVKYRQSSGNGTVFTLTKYVLTVQGLSKKLEIKLDKINDTDPDHPAVVPEELIPLLYGYAKTFFDNGGAKLHVYQGVPTVENSKLVIGSITIPDEEIAVAGIDEIPANIDDMAGDYNNAPNPATSAEDARPNKDTSAAKLFVVSTPETYVTDVNEDNVAIKHGEFGIEMTILAYLSQINAYGENTVHDYNFTIEKVEQDENYFNIVTSDADAGELMQNFINFDCELAKAIRNVGGDLVHGGDLVNYYVSIILQQTVEEAVMIVLSEKLSGAEGTAKIYNAVVSELNKYVHDGLLAAGNWEDEDWVEEFNDESFVVVNANERLTLGYKVMVIPFAELTQAQVSSHMCPPIFVALTTQYGIRKVIINGEVR